MFSKFKKGGEKYQLVPRNKDRDITDKDHIFQSSRKIF